MHVYYLSECAWTYNPWTGNLHSPSISWFFHFILWILLTCLIGFCSLELIFSCAINGFNNPVKTSQCHAESRFPHDLGTIFLFLCIYFVVYESVSPMGIRWNIVRLSISTALTWQPYRQAQNSSTQFWKQLPRLRLWTHLAALHRFAVGQPNGVAWRNGDAKRPSREFRWLHTDLIRT
jgi:hypothetical protein